MTFEGVLGILGIVCAIVFGYIAFLRNKKSDDSSEARQDGQVLTELGYMKSGIDDIKNELRDQRKTNVEMERRLAAVEASSKQAHHRIDRLEGREAH